MDIIQPVTSLQLQAQPRPRSGRSQAEIDRIRVKNRRLEYLRRNPSYVESSDREFVNVTLYHTLIRSFQTPAERSAEARGKGFGQVLEASILRNPEPLQRVDDEDIVEEDDDDEEMGEKKGQGKDECRKEDDIDLDSDDEGTPQDVARRRWHLYVREWFVRGAADEDGFDYAAVDGDSDYDTQARADEQDAWFDDAEPEWADGDGCRELTGQTGVQDY